MYGGGKRRWRDSPIPLVRLVEELGNTGDSFKRDTAAVVIGFGAKLRILSSDTLDGMLAHATEERLDTSDIGGVGQVTDLVGQGLLLGFVDSFEAAGTVVVAVVQHVAKAAEAGSAVTLAVGVGTSGADRIRQLTLLVSTEVATSILGATLQVSDGVETTNSEKTANSSLETFIDGGNVVVGAASVSLVVVVSEAHHLGEVTGSRALLDEVEGQEAQGRETHGNRFFWCF